MFDSFSGKAESLLKGVKHKERKYSCSFVSDSLVINQDGIISSYCILKKNRNLILDDNFNFLWMDTKKISEKINLYKSKFEKEYPTDACIDCLSSSVHSELDKKAKAPIKKLYLSHWKCCPFNCLYCERERIEDISTTKHFDIMPVITQLLDEKYIDKKTEIIFDCGDATLHPDFDKLLYFLLEYGMTNIIINTSAIRFCQSVADAIGKNSAKVYIPIDAGSRFQMDKIKQLDKYTVLLLTINRYRMYQDKNKKNIVFKFTLIKGVNDNTEEILQFFLLTKNANINIFCLDIDDRWFYEVRYTSPEFLNEIISFTLKLAKINNYSIEISDKIKYLYSKRILKNEV